jgi:hypothetical protein
MSVCLRDDNKKYFLDWNASSQELVLSTWNYVPDGANVKLQLMATQSIGGSAFGSPIYGSWYDDSNQSATIADNPTTMLCGHGSGNGITKISNTDFKVSQTGVYNLQFSVQLDESSGAGEHVYIWFRKNGVDIPYSASEVAIQGSLAESIPSWNFVLEMNANDYVNIMWSVTDTRVYLKAVAPNTIPGIPSVIITMWKL